MYIWHRHCVWVQVVKESCVCHGYSVVATQGLNTGLHLDHLGEDLAMLPLVGTPPHPHLDLPTQKATKFQLGNPRVVGRTHKLYHLGYVSLSLGEDSKTERGKMISDCWMLDLLFCCTVL